MTVYVVYAQFGNPSFRGNNTGSTQEITAQGHVSYRGILIHLCLVVVESENENKPVLEFVVEFAD